MGEASRGIGAGVLDARASHHGLAWRLPSRRAVTFLAVALPGLLYLWLMCPGLIQADHQTSIALLAVGTPSQQHSLLARVLLYWSPSLLFYGVFQLHELIMYLMSAPTINWATRSSFLWLVCG